jgi:uncharacterized protein (DUF305 family)
VSPNTVLQRALITAASLATALVLAACGGNTDNPGAASGSTNNPPAATQSGSTAAKSWNDADVSFAQMMIADHKMVVDMAAIAETKASSSQLKTLATQMKSGQNESITQLTAMLKTWGKPTTGDMAGMNMPGAMTEADMAELKAMKGMEFDMMFAKMMVEHHNGSIQMCRDELTNGLSAEAKAMANEMIKTETAQVTALQKFAKM